MFSLLAGLLTSMPAFSEGSIETEIALPEILHDHTSDSQHNESKHPILPIPLTVLVDPQKVELGRRLFEDKRLSNDGSMACRSCHYMDKGGADGKKFSKSIDGGFRKRNTPTIYNVGLNALFGWDGVSISLENVTEGIIKSKKGLATNGLALIARIFEDPDYVRLFNASYPDGVQPENVNNALAEYMRSLITPNSRFDKYLRGDEIAINKQEKEGYRLFKAYGCASCHQGVAVGGNMVAPFNIFRNYLEKEKTIDQIEFGRFNKTKNERDKYVFRVPSLRNIELTAPYFHDGSSKDLESSVEVMGRYMLGRVIPVGHQKKIVSFLKTLTGEYQGEPL